MQDCPKLSDGVVGDLSLQVLWQTCLRLAFRAAADPGLASLRVVDRELAQAELAGQISEFYALGIQAIFAMAKSPAYAENYLRMAELVAVSSSEESTIAQWWEMYNGLNADQEQNANELTFCDNGQMLADANDLLDMFHLAGILKVPQHSERERSRAA